MIDLLNQISCLEWILLIIAGFLFGIAFTTTHFWTLKNWVFKRSHFKFALFLLTLIRLFIFGIAFWIVINLHQNILEILVFFIAFTIARWLIFAQTKRMLNNGQEL